MVTMVTSKNIGIQIMRIFEYSRLPLVTRLVVDGCKGILPFNLFLVSDDT
jgi:hypothetical protein